MKNLTKVLEEAVGQANTTDQKDLLNFVRAKSAAFEAAQDATAVDTILVAAVSANSITQEGKDILFTAVQKSLAMSTAESNPSPSTEDPTETVTTVSESAAANIPNDNMEQAASPSAEGSVGPGRTSARGVGTAILTAGSYTAGITAGLFWLLILYLLATWIAVGSLSSIQFREDIYQKYNTTLNEIMELKNLKL